MRRQVLWWVAALLALGPLPWAMAEEAAPPVPIAPQRMEIITPPVPFTMRAADAEALVRGLAIAPATPAVAAPAAVQAAAGVTRTIHVAAPEVVNRSPYFQFRAVTQDAAVVAPERSLAERRAAVERYRQSLRRGAGR